MTRCLRQHLSSKGICTDDSEDLVSNTSSCDLSAKLLLQNQVRVQGATWAEHHTGCKVPCTREVYKMRKKYVLPQAHRDYSSIMLTNSWHSTIRFVLPS